MYSRELDKMFEDMPDILDERAALHCERDEWRRWCIQVADRLGVTTEDLPDGGVLEQWVEMRRRILENLSVKGRAES